MKEISALTLAEKQQLLELIWDSIDDESNYTVFDAGEDETPEELKLLDERLAEHEKYPSSAMPWEQAFEGLKKRI